MDTKDKNLTPQQKWDAEIRAAEKELVKFDKRAKKVVKKFIDERDTLQGGNKWFNVYYANVNILEAALYAQPPKPAVNRRFKDYEDDVGRVAGTILQRAITQDLDDPTDSFDSTMRHCVQDRLIPGLSQAWVRLETDTEELETPQELTEDQEEVEPMRQITDQRICIDYVFWGDFLWSPCRVWEERRWVGRKVYMTKDKLVERFGEEKANTVSIAPAKAGVGTKSDSTPENNPLEEACIYEIWDRTTKKVIWFSKSAKDILEEIDDPLQLKGFDPCPTPMLANITTSNTVPRPDYFMIQDQYNELDTINNRISMLLKACKVIGVYDKTATGIARMLKEGADNELIPVDNWAMFAEKNGLKGQIDWLPLDTVIQAIQRLNEAREIIKSQIYELTGISDIVRGASKASETLGAQEIKSQFASIRIKKLQDEVARFASELMRIKAEIMCRHFDPQVLIKKSGIMAISSDQQYVQAAIELLQNAEDFEWRIQVSADSIAQADYAMEKKDRTEFLTAVGGYIEKAGAMMLQNPSSGPLLVGMLKWAVAGFRNAAEIEGLIDKELDAMLKQPEPLPKQDPEVIKAQTAQQQAQAKSGLDQQQAAAKAELDKLTAANQAEIDQAKSAADMAIREREAEVELSIKTAHAEFERNQLKIDEERMRLEFQTLQEKTAVELKHQQNKYALELQFLEERHGIELQSIKDKAAAQPTPGATSE